MSLRDALAAAVARDSRYSIQAYAFVLEALEHAKNTTKAKRAHPRARTGRTRSAAAAPQHVTGQELCLAARELALRQYGLLALVVLSSWGLHATSDLGEIVYNLIATGDLQKSPEDSRQDFDDVYDFETAFRHDYDFELDSVA